MINPCDRCLPRFQTFIALNEELIVGMQAHTDAAATRLWDETAALRHDGNNIIDGSNPEFAANDSQQDELEGRVAKIAATSTTISFAVQEGLARINAVDCSRVEGSCPKGAAIVVLMGEVVIISAKDALEDL